MTTRSSAAKAAVVAAALAAAFAAGRLTDIGHAESARLVEPAKKFDSYSETSTARGPASPPSLAVVDPIVLREAVRLALAEASARPAAKYGADAAPAKNPMGSAESQSALQTAEGLVTRALSAHVWTADNVTEIREVLPQLNEQQAQTVLSRLIPAVNRGEVKVQTNGPLF